MINLEYHREKIKDFLDENLRYAHRLEQEFEIKMNYGDNYIDKFLNWLLQEYKEPIKLTQCEYDLLDIYARPSSEFKQHELFLELSTKGHFKGIKDTSMKIKDILASCKVVK